MDVNILSKNFERINYPLPCWSIESVGSPTIIVAPVTDALNVCCQIWLDAGSYHDPKGHHGLAHLYEHMIYSAGSPIDLDTARVDNAFTSHDSATHSIKCLPESLERNFQRISLAISNPEIDSFVLDNEKSVIKNECRSKFDKVSVINAERFAHDFFSGHPYSIPVIGTDKGVAQCSPEDVSTFSKNHGSLAHSIVLTGAITLNETHKLIENGLFNSYSHNSNGSSKLPFTQRANVSYDGFNLNVTLGFLAPLVTDHYNGAAGLFIATLQSHFARAVFPSLTALSMLRSFNSQRVIKRQASLITMHFSFNIGDGCENNFDKILQAFNDDLLDIEGRISVLSERLLFLERGRVMGELYKINNHVSHAHCLGWLSSTAENFGLACESYFSTAKVVDVIYFFSYAGKILNSLLNELEKEFKAIEDV